MNRNKKPTFTDYEAGPDFDRARTLIATPFQYKDIDLSVALNNEIFQCAGDFLYLDAASTGYCTLELNNQWNAPAAPFLAQPGFAIEAIFKQIKISAPAQSGKFIRLMYSTGERIAPTNSTSINGSISVSDSGYQYSSSFKSIAALSVNTAQSVFSAASNTQGAIVWRAAMFSYATPSFTHPCLIANATAPASVTDGDVIASADNGFAVGAYLSQSLKLEKPVKIAPGKGLFFIASAGENTGSRSVLYSLL
jgi:hypothetical protein